MSETKETKPNVRQAEELDIIVATTRAKLIERVNKFLKKNQGWWLQGGPTVSEVDGKKTWIQGVSRGNYG